MLSSLSALNGAVRQADGVAYRMVDRIADDRERRPIGQIDGASGVCIDQITEICFRRGVTENSRKMPLLLE